MTLAVAAVASLVVAGGVAAVALREGMLPLLGLTLVLILAPLVAEPFPSPLALAVRVVGAILIAVVLRATLLPETPPTEGSAGSNAVPEPAAAASALGWPAEALLAVAGAALGWAAATAIGGIPGTVTGVDTPAAVASATTGIAGAAAGALLLLGATPALLRDARRAGVALILLVQGVLLVEAAFAGAPSDLGQVGAVALLVATASGGAALSRQPG